MPFNFLLPLLIRADTSKLATHAKMSKFLWDRQARLTPLFEKGDVDAILRIYDKDLMFSDHGE